MSEQLQRAQSHREPSLSSPSPERLRAWRLFFESSLALNQETITSLILNGGRNYYGYPGGAPADATDDGIEVTFSAAARAAQGSNGLETFLGQLRPRDYFALLAYVPPDDPALGPLLRHIRNAVAVEKRCATMLGYGPRYLHSTGQLHKVKEGE